MIEIAAWVVGVLLGVSALATAVFEIAARIRVARMPVEPQTIHGFIYQPEDLAEAVPRRRPEVHEP